MTEHQRTIDGVKRYYGEVLKSSADLKTTACCTDGVVAPYIAEALDEVHPDVKARFYGCGSPIPPALEGMTVLDLGCGSGRDCYVLSKLVGPHGRVIGVDMTTAQLDVARSHIDYHARKFGHANVEFREGYIEELDTAGIGDASIDVVISNCVLNLSPDKPQAYAEIFRVLKPGGELYFSDVFADRRVPAQVANDPVLRGECLGGALYGEDFRRIVAAAGCRDARLIEQRRLTISNPDFERRVGKIEFYSTTIRAFRLDLEDRCEDYGQAAIYRGTLPNQPHAFDLDDHHHFETGRAVTVCGNTADMLTQTRYARHFRVIGTKSVHYGLFDCGPASRAGADGESDKLSCC